MVTEAPPRVLIDVISDTPEIWARCRSNGAATDEATVAGSAPGGEADTMITGKSTRGIGATGRKRYATRPMRNNPAASRDVPTGRRINGSDTFTGWWDRFPRAGAKTLPAPAGRAAPPPAGRRRRANAANAAPIDPGKDK